MERIDNRHKNRDYEVTIRAPEFTCLCPMTSQPDFAEITITYVPGPYIVELKSLKIYLHGYRNQGIFHEEAVNRIMNDFVELIQPKRVEIVGKFNVRGGIYTTVSAKHPQSLE
ncbi:MAG: NADPH-dependent 7-cyano-7-deazaguanine reductase QueF [Deltaproteobacteria bacterium]|nr:NADPH-dependent 7-cyano-7-deazaguanine reductase QueF [Deltaproteobacteria bacterium]